MAAMSQRTLLGMSATLGVAVVVALWWWTLPTAALSGAPAALPAAAKPQKIRPQGLAPRPARQVTPAPLAEPMRLHERKNAPAAPVVAPAVASSSSSPNKIRGRVSGGRGDLLMVFGCGRHVPVQPDGSFELEGEPGERCEVYALRRDGALQNTTEAIEVIVGSEGAIDLSLPEQATGGIGAIIQPSEDGILLQALVDSGGADQAGLVSGDVIVAVDGQSVVGMDVPQAQGLITGPEGSEVTLTVSSGGQEREVTITRGWIEPHPEYAEGGHP